MLAPAFLAAPVKWAGSALVLMIGLALLLFTATGQPAAAAATDNAVDCTSLSLSFEAKDAFELNCEEKSELLAGMDGGTVEMQHLSATATDANVFVDAVYFSLLGRVIYTGTDLRSNFQDYYEHLSVKGWRSGQAVADLSTAEFEAEMRGLPSRCVAFQKMAHRDQGGYKKLIIGVSCTQGDLSLAYAALKRLHVPN